MTNLTYSYYQRRSGGPKVTLIEKLSSDRHIK